MSSFLRPLAKKRDIPLFLRLERTLTKAFTSSDWLITGFFIVLMLWGTGVMFAKASIALSNEIPVHGGMLHEGVIGSPRFINPLLATSDTDRDLSALVYGGLMKPEPDGSLSPLLAESYDVSKDGLTYTFHLKDGISFHDGTPITAEDVVFTIEQAKNPEIKSPRRANWEGVGVVASDSRTVVFTLRAPYALFLENTTLGIIPKALWSGVSSEEFPFSDLNVHPVGSGIYNVARVKKNQSGIPVEYTMNAFENGGVRPYIKRILFSFYPDSEALERAFESGEIAAAHSIAPENGVIEEAVYARIFGVFFNQNQQELFADEVVRRALNRAIDKKRIVDTVLGGYGSTLTGPLPPQKVASDESPAASSGEALASAQAILDANGWKRGEDGIYEKTVKKATTRLAFTLSTANAPELKSAATLVAEDWRALGADVTVQLFDQNDLNTGVLRPRKYDALLFGEVVGRELDLFAFWHSSQRNDPGLNIALYANITADKNLENARGEISIEERLKEATLAAETIQGETAAVFLYAPHFIYAHEGRLRGVNLGSIATPADRFAGIENWYVATEYVWPFLDL